MCQIGVMNGYTLESIRFELWWCQIGVMTGYRLESIRLELWWCQIGVMNGYRMESIRFELRCVSDWCDDWLQAGEYKV